MPEQMKKFFQARKHCATSVENEDDIRMAWALVIAETITDYGSSTVIYWDEIEAGSQN